MTEAEWLVCNEPTAMLGSLRCPVSERKLHLFACGCCRAVWECIPLGLHRKLVDVAEQCADGRLGHGILELVEKRARAQSALPNEAIHGAFAALAVTNVIGWWAASRTLLAAREAVCKWAVTVASTGELPLLPRSRPQQCGHGARNGRVATQNRRGPGTTYGPRPPKLPEMRPTRPQNRCSQTCCGASSATRSVRHLSSRRGSPPLFSL